MCNGIIVSLDDQDVALTGKVSIRGKHTVRSEIVLLLEERGIRYKQDANRATLVVHGDLSGQHVIDEWNRNSQKLEFVRYALKRGRHICVATSGGFSSLIEGGKAPCQTWIKQTTYNGA